MTNTVEGNHLYEKDSYTQGLVHKINKDYPDFKASILKLISEGYDNDVLDIDDEYIFRFTKKGVNFQVEATFLKELQGFIKMPIPYPLFIAKDFSFTGYKKISGLQFGNKILNKLSDEERLNISTEIALFLIELHSFNEKPGITKMKPPIYNRAKNNWARIPELMKNETNPKVLEFASLLKDDWLRYSETETTEGLLHNDMYSRNIFISDDLKSISGIIDFSDMTYSDINLEFMSMYFENKEFTKLIIDRYQELAGNKLDIAKIELYAKTFALTEYFFNDPLNHDISIEWIFGNAN